MFFSSKTCHVPGNGLRGGRVHVSRWHPPQAGQRDQSPERPRGAAVPEYQVPPQDRQQGRGQESQHPVQAHGLQQPHGGSSLLLYNPHPASFTLTNLRLFCRRKTSPPTPSSWTKSMTAAVRWTSCASTASLCPSCPLPSQTSSIFSSLSQSATRWSCPPPTSQDTR